MSIMVGILGETGTGKSASMRNMKASETLLIQAVKKPLPFRSNDWGYYTKQKPNGNISVSDDWQRIIQLATATQRKVVVIDDFQYVLANEFMRRSEEKGFDKFTDIGKHTWTILSVLAKLPDDKRIYFPWHTDVSESGRVKAKTIGKMLDEKITIEGLFTIVMRTCLQDGQYYFSTRNNGSDTVKTPMGLFESALIDNDLAAVDAAICNYYNITPAASAA